MSNQAKLQRLRKFAGDSEYYLDLENEEVNPLKRWTFARSKCIHKFAFDLSVSLIL